MRLITLLAAILLWAAPAFAIDQYEFDKEHTNIMFYANHIGFSNMMGRFTEFSGGFHFDPKQPEQSSVGVTLKPTGIQTSSSALDRELQSEHFFHSSQFPSIRFKSTGIKVTGKNTGDVTGDLTLLGITKPVVLHVRFNKADYHPITNQFVAGFSADTVIHRSDFGMDYLVPMVSNDIRLEIEAEGINIDRKNAERIKH